MTRDKLEKYLGNDVEVILFDGTVIEGILHKTGEKAFENDPNLSVPVNFYFCIDVNNKVVKNTAFRVSHIRRISCCEKLRMTNFEKIKQMSIDEMARSCSCPYNISGDPPYINCNCKIGEKFKYNCIDCTKHWLESEVEE